MIKQRYYCHSFFRNHIISTIKEINHEVGRTVLRFGCGLYTEGHPQEVLVIGENYEAIDCFNKKIWGC